MSDYIITPAEAKELIAVFTQYLQGSLQNLLAALQKGDAVIWKNVAHKLSASAADLGAQYLANLCAEAEAVHEATPAQKVEIFKRIQAVYAEALHELRQHFAVQGVS
jgi:HPt (histidine-containing phosphotransfer) domain-containing protein